MTDPTGRSVLLHGKTDKRGCFTISTENRAHLEPGEHGVQVFVTAGGQAAESESEARVIPVG